MDGRKRADIKPGDRVQVVQKQDQRSAIHPHGIKVRLESGVVGRVKFIITKGDIG